MKGSQYPNYQENVLVSTIDMSLNEPDKCQMMCYLTQPLVQNIFLFIFY